MQKAERLALATVRGVLEPDGLRVGLMASARHPHILVSAPDGWSRTFSLACSARADDQCQVNYARQKANALLREFRTSRGRAGSRAATAPRAGDPRPAGPRQPPGDAHPPTRPPAPRRPKAPPLGRPGSPNSRGQPRRSGPTRPCPEGAPNASRQDGAEHAPTLTLAELRSVLQAWDRYGFEDRPEGALAGAP